MSERTERRGIHLIGQASSSEKRLTQGEFYGDIIPDRLVPDIWFYVVQRRGSPDILALGTCTSAHSARAMAARSLEDLSRRVAAAFKS